MMSPRKLELYFMALCLICCSGASASARQGDFSIQTGQGEEFQVKHNILGQRNFAVQDRLGDRLARDKDFLGNSRTDVSLLGNDFQRKKNIFGNKSVTASDMLGDKIETKRSWFGLGRRHTSINLSGSAGLVGQFVKKRPLGNFSAPNAQSGSTANSQIDSAFPDQGNATPPQASGIPGVTSGTEHQ